jgi:hypothetical protein
LELLNNKPLKQKQLIKTIITLLKTILKKEICRQSAAINTVAAYYKFKKEGAYKAPQKRLSTKVACLIKTKKAI